MNIVSERLNAQHLVGKRFNSASSVVGWLGAVQAQDYAASKWALSLRMVKASDADIERAYNEGSIIRTHVLRPTWHFVHPANLRWMEELTAPRVKALLAYYNRKLELTEALFSRASEAICRSLRDQNYLTRQELKEILADIHIDTDVQRLAHIVMWAELDGLICSGPRRGKKFTYALVDERVPKVKSISRDEALGQLALLYFASHGPAQLKDFSWWSGLSVRDSQYALSMVKSTLHEEVVGDKTYWCKERQIEGQKIPAFFLSIYDEYTIAYKDRSLLAPERYVEKLIQMGNALNSVVLIGGAIRGTWKRALKNDQLHIAVSPLYKFSKNEELAIQLAAQQYGVFYGMRISVEYLPH
jgi:hypothetical protein